MSLLYRLYEAESQAAWICRALARACVHIQVAGSIRRGEEMVHDIDIVAQPIVEVKRSAQASLFGEETAEGASPVNLLGALADLGWYRTDTLYPRIIHLGPEAGGVQQIPVELYLTEPDGNNWGALLQMRTGDEHFNKLLAVRAQRLGLRYNAGYGITRAGRRVDDGSEEGIFVALGMSWVPVDRRDGAAQPFRYPAKREK